MNAPVTMIDPEAKVHPTARVGLGAAVWGLARIHDGVVLGEHTSVGEMTYVGRGAKIGDHTRIGAQCYIVDHVTIGERCFIAPMVTFTNDRHPVVNNPCFKRESPVLEDDVSIGANATILPGVTLHRGCTVGAGSVVTKDVPAYTTVAGNPARRLRAVPA